MSPFWKSVGFGVVSVLVLDTAASIASARLSFPYAYASAGSLLIYLAIGYVVFRTGGLAKAIGAALVVETVDATLGWFISWKIGPGALPAEQSGTGAIVASIVFVLLFSVVCAVIGSGLARVIHGPLSTNA